MRLSPAHISLIKPHTQEIFGADACAWLFGSRVDDAAKGGDFDLLVETRCCHPRLRWLIR